MNCIARFMVATGLALGVSMAGAQSVPMKIGISLPLTGPDAALGAQMQAGAQACLAASAAGRRGLRLEVLDDAGQPERALANVRALAAEPRTVLLLGGIGTAVNAAAAPAVEELRIPMVGAASGAESVRLGGGRYLFHVRAGHAEEAAAIVAQLYELGIQELAVVHGDNVLGRDGLEGTRVEMNRLAIRPAGVVKLPAAGAPLSEAVKSTLALQQPAVLLIAEHEQAAAFIKELRVDGRRLNVMALSAVSADQLMRDLGEAARGVSIAQVLPPFWGGKLAVTREYQAAMKAAGFAQLGYASMEGCIEARLAAEAVQRVQGEATREKLLAVLDKGSFDLGGYVVRYAPGERRGSRFVELSTIGPGGRMMR